MKKLSLLFSVVALMAFGTASAQSYYTFERSGAPDGFELIPAAGTAILTVPSDDVFSSWQTLPFAFDFYGTAVTGYKASDNGYITFDASAVSSTGNNVAVPAAAEPNNAIYGYWDDLELKAGAGTVDQVIAATYGTAPNRIHQISWVSVTQKSTGDFLYITIRLHENGGFEIVHSYGVITASGTAGCENASASEGINLGASPALAYNYADAGNSDDKTYEFFPGPQSGYDVKVTTLDVDDVIAGNECITGTLRNMGTNTINGFDVNWQIDGGTTYYRSYTGITIPSGSFYNFSNGSPIGLTAGTTHDIDVWISNLNVTETDEKPADNSVVRADVIVANGTVSTDKKVLLEEFTGAWCGWCPDGALKLEDIKTTYSDVVGVAVHQGDAMAIPGATGVVPITDRFGTFYPGGMVDRAIWPGEAEVNTSRTSWETHVQEALTQTTPFCISIDNSFDAATRLLTTEADVTLVDYLPSGDYRVSVYVILDGITGTGSGYNQVNYYSGNSSYPSHPFFSQPDPIVGYVHNNVVIQVPTGTWGDATVIPSTQPGPGTYSGSWTYTIPASFDVSNMRVAAFVNQYDGSDDGKMNVYNAIESSSLTTSASNSCSNTTSTAACPENITPQERPVGIEELEGATSVEVYPNPISEGNLYINVNMEKYQDVVLNVYNAMGQQLVTSGNMEAVPGGNLYFVDTDAFASGTYFVSIRQATDGKELYAQPFVVQ